MNTPTMPAPHGGAYTVEELEQVAAGTHVIVGRAVVPKPPEPAPAAPSAPHGDGESV